VEAVDSGNPQGGGTAHRETGGQGLGIYRAAPRVSRELVTPDFPKKTKCKPICMPGSIFMHIVIYK
jgi:hypothetical protein